MNDDKRNQLMAIVLSLAVLLGWNYFFVQPRQAELARQAQIEASKVPPKAAAPTGAATPAGPGAIPGTVSAVADLSREDALKLSPRVAIATPDLAGSISLKGGRIDDLVLTKYGETVKPDSPRVVLLEPDGAKESYFAEFGWVPALGQSFQMPSRDALWTQVGSGTLTPATPVTLSLETAQGLTFRRTFSVDDKYLFTVKDEIENKGTAPVVLQPYGLIYRNGMPKTSGFAVLHEGLVGVLSPDNSVGLQEVKYDELKKEASAREKEHKTPIGEKAFKDIKNGWLGFTDKYWAAVLVPPTDVPLNARMLAYNAVPGGHPEGFQTEYELQPITIEPGTTKASEQRLFAGAKEVGVLNAYAGLGIKRFDLMIDWGWFQFIAKPMYWLISHLYGLLGNFGLAILAVTVLAKAAFFPLANKSYESMAKMKKMQPEMERIKGLYKDDRERQQKEMMKLYSEHKINPASGCLPMLLQFPVFFALYKVLVITIDMRHAPFFGWVHDLSAPDPTNVFNLFGLLPFDPTAMPLIGHWLYMGFWPLVMGITMWMTMQLNPQQADPTQQKIMNWMPVMFTFTMAGFPAGLVIYWAWSNSLSLLQQYYIMKKNGAEVHLWKNIGLDRLVERMKKRSATDTP